jgi:hypothetical protein
MTYDLPDQEKQGVLDAPDEKRYAYFINKAADTGEIWGLAQQDDRWASLAEAGTTYFPVWSHPGFAEDAIDGGWSGFEAKPIEVHSFLDHLADLDANGDMVAILRTAQGDYLTMPPAPLADDLRVALAEVE